MDGLFQMCDDEGIDVHELPLTRSKNILGWYYRTRQYDPVIALDIDLRRNRPLGRTVLGEEIAHHQTIPIGTLTSKHVVYAGNNRTNRWRDESKAVRRCTEILIPTLELREVLRGETGPVDARLVAELAEYFVVIPWLVWRKFHFLRQDLKLNEGLRVGVRDLRARILVEHLWGLQRPECSDTLLRIRNETSDRRKAVSMS